MTDPEATSLRVAINTAKTLAKQLRSATELGDLKSHAANAATVLEYLATAANEANRSEPPRLFVGKGDERRWTPSEAVEKDLAAFEWFGQPSRHELGAVDLFNCDGDRVAHAVQANIEPRTLRAIRYETREAFERGERQGRETMRARFRDLIGAAAQGDTE